MNRQQKRIMQRQGQVGANASDRRRAQRATPREFFTQVREELRQVAWPTRPETINYTSIVAFVLVFMTLLIFGLGAGFSKFVTFLFQK